MTSLRNDGISPPRAWLAAIERAIPHAKKRNRMPGTGGLVRRGVPCGRRQHASRTYPLPEKRASRKRGAGAGGGSGCIRNSTCDDKYTSRAKLEAARTYRELLLLPRKLLGLGQRPSLQAVGLFPVNKETAVRRKLDRVQFSRRIEDRPETWHIGNGEFRI